MSSSNQENPSQISGHLQYAKGAASEMIGNMTSMPSWQDSGREDKQAALNEMRAAKQQADQTTDYDSRNPTTLNAEGKAQGIAGGLTGCGEMQERGSEKQQAADQKLSEQ